MKMESVFQMTFSRARLGIACDSPCTIPVCRPASVGISRLCFALVNKPPPMNK